MVKEYKKIFNGFDMTLKNMIITQSWLLKNKLRQRKIKRRLVNNRRINKFDVIYDNQAYYYQINDIF